MRKDDGIDFPDDRADRIHPLLVVLLQRFDGGCIDTSVSPCMACELVALGLQRIRDDLCFRHILIIVELWMLIQPDRLVRVQMLRIAREVDRIRAITEHAVITGQRDHAVSVVVGEIRMRVDETGEKRHDVVITDQRLAVFIDVFALHLSVLVEDQLRGDALIFIRVIVAQVVLGHNDRVLAGREHKVCIFLKMNFPVLVTVLRHKVVHRDEHTAVVVHLLRDRVEFVNGAHPGVVVICDKIAGDRRVKSARIVEERVIEHMRNLLDVVRDTGRLRVGIALDRSHIVRVGLVSRLGLNIRNCGIIIVHGSHPV